MVRRYVDEGTIAPKFLARKGIRTQNDNKFICFGRAASRRGQIYTNKWQLGQIYVSRASRWMMMMMAGRQDCMLSTRFVAHTICFVLNSSSVFGSPRLTRCGYRKKKKEAGRRVGWMGGWVWGSRYT